MLQVIPIPAFNDNYIWMIRRGDDPNVVVVDPGDAGPVLKRLQEQQLTLSAVLITHHHGDHIGGINDLLTHFDVPVYGPNNPKIKAISHVLREGDQIKVLSTDFSIMEVPGHTLDHIAYFSDQNEPPVLFCGDTLFVGGCGRLFEGTAAQMHHSLSRLAQLPAATKVYCAHEYTLANLKFAAAVEPDNEALNEYIAQCQGLRSEDTPTVPSTVANELLVNPFLRSNVESVKRAAESYTGESLDSSVAVFSATRAWKDNF